MVNDEKAKKQLKKILVVKDFPYVFPDDLTYLPLDRETEFEINIDPEVVQYLRLPIE